MNNKTITLKNTCLLSLATVILLVLTSICNLQAQQPIPVNNSHRFYDASGRQFIPRGYVMNTEEGPRGYYYSANDYLRAARIGANFQIIRLNLGKIGGWPEHITNEAYLLKLDSMIRLGSDHGMKTGFKMTVYNTRGFSWNALWENKNNEKDILINAWMQLWKRYRHNDDVFLYDLLNEPMLGELEISYDELQTDHLIPLYEQLIDSLRTVDTKKWAKYQPILLEMNPDRARRMIPFQEMKVPLNRERIIYGPHIYQLDLEKIGPTLHQYQKDAALSNAPMILGEWGSATYEETDASVIEQHKYQLAYIRTAEIADSLGLGMIKAWFLGSRWKGRNHHGMFTWAIFKDSIGVGTTERKYIVDILARPYPMAIAGTIKNYRFNHSTREFEMTCIPGQQNHNSEIFVGANRHYPDGFTLQVNDNWIAVLDPIQSNQLKVITKDELSIDTKITWDNRFQKLIIEQLPTNKSEVIIKIIPGTLYQMMK